MSVIKPIVKRPILVKIFLDQFEMDLRRMEKVDYFQNLKVFEEMFKNQFILRRFHEKTRSWGMTVIVYSLPLIDSIRDNRSRNPVVLYK